MLNEQWDAKADPEARGWQKCLQTSHDVMGYSERPFFWIVSCIWDLLSQQVVSLSQGQWHHFNFTRIINSPWSRDTAE